MKIAITITNDVEDISKNKEHTIIIIKRRPSTALEKNMLCIDISNIVNQNNKIVVLSPLKKTAIEIIEESICKCHECPDIEYDINGITTRFTPQNY